MKDCLFLFQVEGGESGDLSFNVFHKRVSELGFQKTAVGNNMTATLTNVMIGEEYEVRVSSLEHSSGKVSALSRGIIVGEKTGVAILLIKHLILRIQTLNVQHTMYTYI